MQNSKHAAELLPTQAATLESKDFVQFSDKIQHHDDTTECIPVQSSPSAAPVCVKPPFDFSVHGYPLYYYSPLRSTSIIDAVTKKSGWSHAPLVDAIRDHDICSAIDTWATSEPGITTPSVIVAKLQSKSSSSFHEICKRHAKNLLDYGRGKVSITCSKDRVKSAAVIRIAAGIAALRATEASLFVLQIIIVTGQKIRMMRFLSAHWSCSLACCISRCRSSYHPCEPCTCSCYTLYRLVT